MNDPILQEIKDRLNITDVIGGYIQLKKAGANFKAPCPFHSEKTASFMVSPQKQIWHCFGCGEGGDIFGFVKKFENLEFREVIKLLAEKAGVKLPQYRPPDPKVQSEKELLLRINNFAARFYHQILIKEEAGKEALEYLKNRGLNSKTIEQWQIGFAPENFHALEQALAKKQVSTQDLVKAGVSVKNEKGQIYDRFRGRITFPIFNYTGEVVGFSARILKNGQEARPSTSSGQAFNPPAKYINSPETLIYSKGQILFGLNFAKEAVRKKDEAVIVEGQMDCISAHQAGFANTVATSGTALTAQQFTALGRQTKNLKFCFDSDSAGQNASRRAGELALKQGFRLKIIKLEKAKDPDELIKKSPGLWEKAVGEAEWFLDQQMALAQSKFENDPVAQKHYLSQEVVPLLGSIQDPLEQDHYVHQLVEKFNISERVVREEIKRYQSAKPGESANTTSAKPSSALKANVLEKEILGGMLVYEDFFADKQAQLEAEEFEDYEIKLLIKELLKNPKILTAVKSGTLAKEAIFMVESQLDDLEGNEQAFKRQLSKTFALFKINAIKNKQQRLTFEIKRVEATGDKNKLGELNKEFAELSKLRMEFEKIL